MGIQETGTPNYMKYINKKKVLQYIKDNNTLSRSDLSKVLNISKPTISNLVEELLNEGWIYEVEGKTASSFGGRKPFKLLFNKEARYVIGVDIGGTLTEIAVMNLEGDFILHTSFETQKILKLGLIEHISSKVQEMIDQSSIDPDKIMALGVGAPGITDVDNGVVIEAPSLGWNQFPLKKELEKYLSYPIYIENDVNVAVLGEQWKGVAKDKNNVILMTLGTGVGCGIVINKQLYRGSNYAAGEVGYMVTDRQAAKQKYDPVFMGYGFLDSHVGGPSIALRMNKRIQKENRVKDYGLEESEWTAERVFTLAKNGDPLALSVVDEVIEHIGFAIINVICSLNPQCVVLGGGISKSAYWFLPKLKNLVHEHLPLQIQTEIFITELPQVSLLGVASLCIRNHESLLKS
jgi:glucokinase